MQIRGWKYWERETVHEYEMKNGMFLDDDDNLMFFFHLYPTDRIQCSLKFLH